MYDVSDEILGSVERFVIWLVIENRGLRAQLSRSNEHAQHQLFAVITREQRRRCPFLEQRTQARQVQRYRSNTDSIRLGADIARAWLRKRHVGYASAYHWNVDEVLDLAMGWPG